MDIITKEYEHKGHQYWVSVAEAENPKFKEYGYLAMVSDTKPNYPMYGYFVRSPNNKILIFGDKLTAFTNANAIKQAEINSSN